MIPRAAAPGPPALMAAPDALDNDPVIVTGRRAARGHPLTAAQKEANRLVSRERRHTTPFLAPKNARVTVNPSRWPVIPRKVSVDGRSVNVGWFTEQDEPSPPLRPG